MNFREEYIRAVEEITPDRQTIDRMKANVLNMTRTKRAFPFKTVAAVGGTAAACAVITLAAVRIAPNLAKNFDNLIMQSVADSSTAAGMNGMAEDKAAVFTEECAPEEACEIFSCDEWDEEPAINGDIYTNKNFTAPAAPAAPSATQDNDGSGGAEPCAIPSPDAVSADELEAVPADNSDAVSPDAPVPHDTGLSDVPASHDASQSEAPAKEINEDIVTDEPNDMPENEWAETLENEWAETLENEWAETLENEYPATGAPVPFIGYTLTIAEDWSECTLSSNEERLTFKRSSQTDTSSFANDMSILYIPLTNTTDNKTYLIALADDTVILKDENNEIVGLFI